jgi:hypothetical protein
MRQRQIKILQEFILPGCMDNEDKQAIENLIWALKRQDGGMIYKSDLAKRYGITLITFNKRIRKVDGLIYELYEKFGYTKWRKTLFPGEVDIIEKYLGLSPEKP